MITTKQAAELIRGSNGSILTVTFMKRGDNEPRVMNCRLKVKKHLKGGEKKFDDKEKNVVTVYDMQKGAYRCISIEGIRGLTMNGKTEIVVP